MGLIVFFNVLLKTNLAGKGWAIAVGEDGEKRRSILKLPVVVVWGWGCSLSSVHLPSFIPTGNIWLIYLILAMIECKFNRRGRTAITRATVLLSAVTSVADTIRDRARTAAGELQVTTNSTKSPNSLFQYLQNAAAPTLITTL